MLRARYPTSGNLARLAGMVGWWLGAMVVKWVWGRPPKLDGWRFDSTEGSPHQLWFVLQDCLTGTGVWLEMSGHGKAARRAVRLAPARGAI